MHYDTFNVTLIDGAGGQATTAVSVAVVGTNETPKITAGFPLPQIHFTGDGNVDRRIPGAERHAAGHADVP